jgi:hypothetical protein
VKTISAPSRRTPSTFTFGAFSGMQITAREPRSLAARATACAWFPDEYVTTPRARSASLSEAILL